MDLRHDGGGRLQGHVLSINDLYILQAKKYIEKYYTDKELIDKNLKYNNNIAKFMGASLILDNKQKLFFEDEFKKFEQKLPESVTQKYANYNHTNEVQLEKRISRKTSKERKKVTLKRRRLLNKRRLTKRAKNLNKRRLTKRAKNLNKRRLTKRAKKLK